VLVPEKFFRLIVRLVSGKNSEGYLHALDEVFDEAPDAPTKGALSQMRKKISFRFFRDCFVGSVSQGNEVARTFRGKRIYGMDGFEMNLPRTEDVLNHHYQGRWVSEHRQQYYPTMFTVFCYDVLSETVKDIRFSPAQGELELAEPMVGSMEEGSLCIYDRLYPCARMIRAHKKAKNHFLFRLKVSSFKDAEKLLSLKIKRRKAVIEGVTVYFIKLYNPKTKSWDLFATDLPRYWVNGHTIRSLYNLRWECETAFLELVSSFRVEQWHSKFLNGILQELYAALWLYNYTKLQILASGQIDKNPLEWEYKKPNFKLILDWVIRKMGRIFKRLLDPQLFIPRLIIRSTERRERHSRSKPRETKYSRNPFPSNNTLWIGPLAEALN
jgi:hypothetical protein